MSLFDSEEFAVCPICAGIGYVYDEKVDATRPCSCQTLDFGPKARADDPATSHAAAEKILATRAGSQRWLLWGAFATHRIGLTDEEACQKSGVSLLSEYATRCSELRNAGVIMVTGEERPGESGLMRDVSIITDLGLSEWGKRNQH